jgi:hypothetical protein
MISSDARLWCSREQVLQEDMSADDVVAIVSSRAPHDFAAAARLAKLVGAAASGTVGARTARRAHR